MRIISGSLKGKRFVPPRDFGGRPTTDYARESLFNILHHRLSFSEISFLDLFAGTGAFTYECFSRGATDLTAVEMNTSAARFIQAKCQEFHIAGANILRQDAFAFIASCRKQYDLVIADPPFAHARLQELPTLVFRQNMLVAGGWLVLEHDSSRIFENEDHFVEERRYGHVHFSFFQN